MNSITPRKASFTFPELNWFLITTIIFFIIIPMLRNFLGWSERELFEQRQWILYWYYSIILVITFSTIIRYGPSRLITDRYNIFLVIAILSFISSVLLGVIRGAEVRPMSVMAPLFAVLIFHIFPRTITNINLVFVKLVLIIFLLAPLVVLFFPLLFKIPFELFSIGSFRGFAESRTDYGFLAGIGILLLVTRPSLTSLMFLPAVFLGLILSENRAALLALIIAIGYQLVALRHRRSTVIIWMIFFVFGSWLFVNNLGDQYLARGVTFFQDSGDRLIIWAATFENVYQNILFGSGAFYQNIYVSTLGRIVEPHNSVLQSILNLGLITTIFWYLIVAKVYFTFNVIGRSFLLYWAIFGLLHPGYDAFLFSLENFIPLLLAVHFGPQRIESLQRWKLYGGALSSEASPVPRKPRLDGPQIAD